MKSIVMLINSIMNGFAVGIAIAVVAYWVADIRPRTEADIQRIACERAICPTPTPGGG